MQHSVREKRLGIGGMDCRKAEFIARFNDVRERSSDRQGAIASFLLAFPYAVFRSFDAQSAEINLYRQ
ncbi:hypothetical protein AA0323_2047 [Asaia siamensis NRIC 0323]|nr:hypothetical protein AA0323_2047 [Asaia siamensis NRIC 0323]